MSEQTVFSVPGDNLLKTADGGLAISPNAGGVILRSVDLLHAHPAYAELNLAVSPEQLAALKRSRKARLEDPLLVTREGIIIGMVMLGEYADRFWASNPPLRGNHRRRR